LIFNDDFYLIFQIMMDKKEKRAPLPEGFSRQSDEAKDHLLPVRTQIEKFEEKARLNFNKSFPAPQPPGRSFALPKIGNYQPKSLLLSSNADKKVNKTDFQKLNDNGENVEEPKKFMIIGDKDMPITIHQSSDIIDTPPENEFFPRFGSDNPVYEPDESSKDTIENDLVLNFEKTMKNPLFQENEENSPRQQITSDTETAEESPREGSDDKTVYRKRPAPPPPILSSPEEEEYPAPDYDPEPEPDYDDEEVPEAMDVNPPTVHPPPGRHLPPVKREKEGEDFSKYMHDSEDEDYFSDNIYTWRNKIKYKRKPAPPRPVSQPAGKKKDNRSKPKEKTKQNQVKSNGHSSLNNLPEENIRKTIRDFSFTDSKIGYDDRTVKSTTAKGRYMKRGKDRLPLQQVSSGSYEDFLRSRYNENNVNGDSGHETGDDFDVLQTDIFRQSQPKQFRNGGKQSVWEKLTWRFKRNSRGYAMT
jgi:hypothetical protein